MANVIWSSGITNAPTVELIVNQSSQSIDGNYSVLSYSLVLHRPSNVSSSASKSYSVTINGVTVASGTTTIGGSGDKIITSGTTTVYHNADGTKSGVPFSFYMDIGLTWSGSATGNASGSGSMNLTTIPRASEGTLSNSSPNFGDTITINIQRPTGTSFTHHVYEDFFVGQWTLITTNGKVATSTTWTIPIGYANRIPNSVSGGCRILIETWNGNTYIGSKILNLTINVPDTATFRPSVSISKSGVDLHSSKYIQGKSKVTVTLNETKAYGSSIVSRFTSVKSGTNVISTSTSSPFTSSVLTYSGTITISTIITDARGRTATASTTISVVAYEPPKVVSFNTYRANSDGTPNDRGAYIKMEGSSMISSIDGTNSRATTLRYRVKGATTWTTGVSNTALYNPSLSKVVSASTNSSFEVQIYVTDAFGSTISTINIGTAFTLLNFTADGRSMAIGKVAEGKAMLELFGDFLVQNMGNDTKLLLEQLQGNAGIEVGNKDLAGLSYIDFHSSGLGADYDTRIIGSGGTSEIAKGLLQILAETVDILGSNFKFNGKNVSVIEEQGTNANGTYIKYRDGTMICWFNRAGTYAINQAWGSMFYSPYQAITFPASFVGLPIVQAQNTNSVGEGIFVVVGATANNFTGYVLRPTSGQSGTYVTYYMAIGRWKA